MADFSAAQRIRLSRDDLHRLRQRAGSVEEFATVVQGCLLRTTTAKGKRVGIAVALRCNADDNDLVGMEIDVEYGDTATVVVSLPQISNEPFSHVEHEAFVERHAMNDKDLPHTPEVLKKAESIATIFSVRRRQNVTNGGGSRVPSAKRGRDTESMDKQAKPPAPTSRTHTQHTAPATSDEVVAILAKERDVLKRKLAESEEALQVQSQEHANALRAHEAALESLRAEQAAAAKELHAKLAKSTEANDRLVKAVKDHSAVAENLSSEVKKLQQKRQADGAKVLKAREGIRRVAEALGLPPDTADVDLLESTIRSLKAGAVKPETAAS